jgi:hypothetical protein
LKGRLIYVHQRNIYIPEPEILDLGIKAFNCTASKKAESTLYLNNVLSHAKPGMFKIFEIN